MFGFYGIKRYKEVLFFFTQKCALEEEQVCIKDSNNNVLETDYNVQFPEYMGTKINILIGGKNGKKY